jgi:hypothetical protein
VLITERYIDQIAQWPKVGRHILAQFDEASVFVYQAYRTSIGEFAVTHGYFGGEFSYSRMSWIKTNFLWMMYRSGWGMKAGQEVTLAIRIRRPFFDSLLAQAVESSYVGSQYATHSEWQKAVTASSVRMQWDPDHHPRGASLPRRALQLGLRRRPLKDFGKRELLEIVDISSFVMEQRMNTSTERIAELITPVERVYVPDDPEVQVRLGIDEIGTNT